MSQSPVWWRVLVLSCIVMFIGYSVSASGQNKSGSTFATVDMQKLSADYKAKDAVETDIRAKQAKLQDKLRRRDQMPFLTDEEQKQLDELYDKANQSDQDKQKIKDLEAKARKVSDELNGLSQKKESELTDAEKKRLEEGNKQYRAAQQSFATLKENLETEFRNYSNTQTDELLKKIKAAIAKVAEQKGIAIVFNSEIAFYAGTDITQAVVSELNKK